MVESERERINPISAGEIVEGENVVDILVMWFQNNPAGGWILRILTI